MLFILLLLLAIFCYSHTMTKLFNTYLKLNLVLFPLFFLPIVTTPFGFGKNWFLLVTALLGLLLWAISLLTDKKTKLYYGRFLGLFFVFLLTVVLSWFRMSASVKSVSLADPNGLTSFIALFIWYFLWLQSDQNKTWASKISFLSISAILISLASLAVFIIPESRLPIVWPSQSPLVTIDSFWSFTGFPLADLILLVFLVIETGKQVFSKSSTAKSGFILNLLKLSLISLGLVVTAYRLTKIGWGGLNYRIGWQITADTFKNSPIWGVGISNFLQSFNLFRPYSYNLTSLWQQRFIVSSSGFFHYWTELGIFYLIFLAILIAKIFKQKKTTSFISIIAICLLNLVLPPSLVGLWLMVFVFAHKLGQRSSTAPKLVMGEAKTNIFPAVAVFVVLLFTSFGLFISTKKLLARVYLRNSYLATAKNDGLATYNQQIKAISHDPHWSELRRIYSQTNLGLAQSLSQKQDISEEDRQQISVLLQQAVREAKEAIANDQTSAVYWQNLATIYKTLIGSVEGAPDWALESYQQTATLDVADPLSRMEMGSLYFASGQYENADRLFEEVLLRKSDYANGWYNWAHTAKNLNRLADGITRLNQAILLVPIDSADYEKASQELTAWRQEYDRLNKPTPPTNQETTLTTPQPLPTTTQPNVIDNEEELIPPVIPGEPADEDIPTSTPQPTDILP